MNLNIFLNQMASQLTGSVASEDQIRNLKSNLPEKILPDWYLSLLQSYPLSGTCFSLEDEDDLSEMGVELKWFSPEEIVDEAQNMFPGKSVLSLGYLPIGACLLGSGDPYFIKFIGSSMNPPLVRIPHDLSADNDYPESEIELVCHSLSSFFEKANIE